MAQVTIYLDKQTQDKARKAARREGLSLSSWARVKLSAAADQGKQWPEGYFDLFGSVSDASFDAPEELATSLDSKRESL